MSAFLAFVLKELSYTFKLFAAADDSKLQQCVWESEDQIQKQK